MKPSVKGTAKSGSADTDKKMVDKVNQQMANDEDSLMARVIGLGLIVLGIVFIVLAVVVVVLSRRSAKIDESLTIPELKAEKYTNQDNVYVKGTTDPDSEVMFFIDGDEISTTLESDEDGAFDGYLPISTEEGEYEIRSATVVGFPIRKRSNKSDTVIVTVDTTPPSVDEVALDYKEETAEDAFSITGTIEPLSIIKVTDGESEFFSSADENGEFEVRVTGLPAKENSYTVSIIDMAGNEVVLEDSVDVVYTNYGLVADGDLNGDGVTIGPDGQELPEAAGIFDDAMDIIAGNQLMAVLGFIVLAVLTFNSGLVFYKLGKRS